MILNLGWSRRVIIFGFRFVTLFYSKILHYFKFEPLIIDRMVQINIVNLLKTILATYFKSDDPDLKSCKNYSKQFLLTISHKRG
jgi:hypothetical protein